MLTSRKSELKISFPSSPKWAVSGRGILRTELKPRLSSAQRRGKDQKFTVENSPTKRHFAIVLIVKLLRNTTPTSEAFTFVVI